MSEAKAVPYDKPTFRYLVYTESDDGEAPTSGINDENDARLLSLSRTVIDTLTGRRIELCAEDDEPIPAFAELDELAELRNRQT